MEMDILAVPIWVQTVCKGYQQRTNVATSKERVKIISKKRNALLLQRKKRVEKPIKLITFFFHKIFVWFFHFYLHTGFQWCIFVDASIIKGDQSPVIQTIDR